MPDVDFVIDIGGQDMKCFKIEHGAISNISVSYTHLDVYKRQVQGDVTALGPAQARALHIHAHQADAGGRGRVRGHARGHRALAAGPDLGGDIGVNSRVEQLLSKETLEKSAFFQKTLALGDKKWYYKLHCCGY